MQRLKMTTEQLINTHCDSLSQKSIAELIRLLAGIVYNERIGIKCSESQAGNIAERWLSREFVENQSKRQMIITALISRWQPRTDL